MILDSQNTKNLTNFEVLFQEDNLLVINKPCGMPVQSANTQDDLLSIVQKDFDKKYELCNRIDQVVSGIVLFSKDKNQIKDINRAFANQEISKVYVALLHKYEALEDKGTLEGYLLHDRKQRKAYVKDKDHPKAKLSSISYEKVAEMDNYYLVKVVPGHGRFHQIRALFSNANLPIKGDVKYGARRKNADRSIHLHSWKIELPKHIFGKSQQFIAPLPAENLWSLCKEYL